MNTKYEEITIRRRVPSFWETVVCVTVSYAAIGAVAGLVLAATKEKANEEKWREKMERDEREWRKHYADSHQHKEV